MRISQQEDWNYKDSYYFGVPFMYLRTDCLEIPNFLAIPLIDCPCLESSLI